MDFDELRRAKLIESGLFSAYGVYMTERIAADSSKIDSSMNAVRISWRAPLTQRFGVAVLSALSSFHSGLPVAFPQTSNHLHTPPPPSHANTQTTHPPT